MREAGWRRRYRITMRLYRAGCTDWPGCCWSSGSGRIHAKAGKRSAGCPPPGSLDGTGRGYRRFVQDHTARCIESEHPCGEAWSGAHSGNSAVPRWKHRANDRSTVRPNRIPERTALPFLKPVWQPDCFGGSKPFPCRGPSCFQFRPSFCLLFCWRFIQWIPSPEHSLPKSKLSVDKYFFKIVWLLYAEKAAYKNH